MGCLCQQGNLFMHVPGIASLVNIWVAVTVFLSKYQMLTLFPLIIRLLGMSLWQSMNLFHLYLSCAYIPYPHSIYASYVLMAIPEFSLPLFSDLMVLDNRHENHLLTFLCVAIHLNFDIHILCLNFSFQLE